MQFSCLSTHTCPGNKDGVACKAVILIELSRFEEALEHVDGHLSQFRELSFEKV